MDSRSYKLNDKEVIVLSAMLMYTQDKKDELQKIIKNTGGSSITIADFTKEMQVVRSPMYNKEFSSYFLDDVLIERLDAFNPVKYLNKGDDKVKLKDYLFMLTLNVRVLQDLEMEALKGNKVR